MEEKEKLQSPTDGVYIDGLFLESGRWNGEIESLDEPIANIIYQNMPIVYNRNLYYSRFG
jgi:hypothetical protein